MMPFAHDEEAREVGLLVAMRRLGNSLYPSSLIGRIVLLIPRGWRNEKEEVG
jgi:hypothetical protein